MTPPTKDSNSLSRILRTSRYDQVSSMLLALLILIGAVVFLLFVAWLTSRIFVSQTAVPVELADFQGDDGPVGGGQQMDPPDPEDVPEIEEEPEITEQVDALSDIVQKKMLELDDPNLVKRDSQDTGFGDGRGGGRGSGVGPGKGGKLRRWIVRFPKGTLDSYARQLQYFGIELGTILPDGRVAYAFNLDKPKPDSRIEPAEAEKRYHLLWRNGDLEKADRELLARAGIQTGEKSIVLKFLPLKVEQRLVEKERARAGADVKSIRSTEFGVQPTSEGYDFFIIKQILNH